MGSETSPTPEEINDELDQFSKIPDWGCDCPLDQHEWISYSIKRLGYWGMCSCKEGKPHLHKLLEIGEAGMRDSINAMLRAREATER